MPILREIIAIKAAFDYSAGPTGEVVYKCAGVDALALIAELVNEGLPGAWGQVAGEGVIRPQRFTIEPLDPGTIPLANGTPEYAKVTASHALDFLDVAFPQQIERPEYAAYTTLKLETKFSGQWLSLDARAIKIDPNQGGGPYPAMRHGTNILIPLIDYHLEWGRVRPDDANRMNFAEYIGKVNASTFLGAPAETLLCEAAEIKPGFVINPPYPRAYTATVVLKQLRIPSDPENPLGWNHKYDENAGWVKYTLSNGALGYPTAIFGLIFE